MLIGLQGAGKTTFAAQRFAETHVLISKDRLRNNRRPERRQQRLIAEALAAGRSVVVDNTNPLGCGTRGAHRLRPSGRCARDRVRIRLRRREARHDQWPTIVVDADPLDLDLSHGDHRRIPAVARPRGS